MHRVWPTASDKLELCMRTKDSISKTLILFAFCSDMNTLHTLTSLLVWVHSFVSIHEWFLPPSKLVWFPPPAPCSDSKSHSWRTWAVRLSVVSWWAQGWSPIHSYLRGDLVRHAYITPHHLSYLPWTTLPRSSATPELNGAVSELLHQQSTVLFLGMKQHCCPCPSCASTALSRDVCLIATGGGVAALTTYKSPAFFRASLSARQETRGCRAAGRLLFCWVVRPGLSGYFYCRSRSERGSGCRPTTSRRLIQCFTSWYRFTPVGFRSGSWWVRPFWDPENIMPRAFLWPRMKNGVSTFVPSNHTCQLTDKPDRTLRPAALRPIPVVSQPFQHLIIDCVGPSARSMSG